MTTPTRGPHECPDLITAPNGGYGPAIDFVDEAEDGTLWVGNGEYTTQVNLCPFCGFAARVKIQANRHPVGERVRVVLGHGHFQHGEVVRHDSDGRPVIRYHSPEGMQERVVPEDALIW